MLRAYLLTLNRSATLLVLLFAALFVSTAQADEPRLSISGYDPVAYFTVGKAEVAGFVCTGIGAG